MRKLNVQMEVAHRALLELCQEVGSRPDDMSTWPKTRDVANACNASIYSARRWLLALRDEGLIAGSDESIHNSLRWYHSPPFVEMDKHQ